jgi:HSP20 family protein
MRKRLRFFRRPLFIQEFQMNALTRPERFDDLFPEMFRRFMLPMASSDFDAPAEIRVDVSETDKGSEIRAEVPGFKKEEIRVTIDGSHVSISADTKRESEQDTTRKGERTLVKELYYSSAARGFRLDHEVDEKNAVQARGRRAQALAAQEAGSGQPRSEHPVDATPAQGRSAAQTLRSRTRAPSWTAAGG